MTARLLACLLLLLSITIAPARASDAPVEGRDYVLLHTPGPLHPADGKIEVVEVFAYTCGHCASFQPLVDAWLRKAPEDVRFTYLPAAFDLNDSYALGYFAAESLGVLKQFHHAAFAAVHEQYALPPRGASPDEIAAFAASLGIDRARFRNAMTSPETAAKMRAAREFAIRSELQGTPTLVVNGKYRVQGRTLSDALRITDALIERERTATR